MQQQKQFKILLLGDDCIDVYQYGTVDRISPEAPVPVFKCSHEEHKPGMAGNVLKNLEALGCNVNFFHNETSIKTRLIDIRSRQHIVRLDNDKNCTPINIDDLFPLEYDAIVISDYNKGTVTYELVESLRREFSGPIFVDTKKSDLKRFECCFIKINELEYSRVTSLPADLPSGLIVTLGKDGARYNDKIFPASVVEVVDVCGAGDTFLSALVVEYLNTNDIESSIEYAIKAGAISVQHSGVYVLTEKDIERIT